MFHAASGEKSAEKRGPDAPAPHRNLFLAETINDAAHIKRDDWRDKGATRFADKNTGYCRAALTCLDGRVR